MKDLGGGRLAYVVGKGAKSVVLFHDICGLHTGRHKQIADEIASRGFLVVVPDFFQEMGGGLLGKEDRGFGTLRSFFGFMCTLVTGRFKQFVKARRAAS